ncbi:MAG: hypothetical protein K8H86_11470 [Ignavibacteriaceae bacterium]|nr:hypothetical protein [Ignavibacteriaceae bacterium]
MNNIISFVVLIIIVELRYRGCPCTILFFQLQGVNCTQIYADKADERCTI